MTHGFEHIADGEGRGIAILKADGREITLRGADAHEAKKLHDNFVARFGHNSPEELAWIYQRILREVVAA